MLPAELKNYSQVRNMGTDVLGGNQNVIHIDKTEREVSKNLLHHSWNVWSAFLKPKESLRNSSIPNGVMMEVFWMSEADIGTW